MGTKKFSIDLEDLYTDIDTVTRATVYHEEDVILEIIDTRGKTWEPTELSTRDEKALYECLFSEVEANKLEAAQYRLGE